jgi:hypothetical protein
MRIRNFRIGKLAAVVSLSVLTLSAYAFKIDPTITIDRATNSPTINIKYTGASAAMIELRLNGVSLGTRMLNAGKTNGDASFTIDLKAFLDGDNEIEAILLDKQGRIVASEKTTINSEGERSAIIQILSPKMGSSVQGPVDVKVGFGREFKSAYVSFFVDNQLKAFVNNSPFAYTWDTSREINGWHEVEAWLVDDMSNTFKTKKIRIFVNNPGGRTNRVTQPSTIKIDVPKVTTPKVQTPKVQTPKVSNVAPQVAKTVLTKTSNDLNAMSTFVVPALAGQTAGLKAGQLPAPISTGPKAVTPSKVQAVTAPKVTTPKGVVQVSPSVKTTPKINNGIAAASLVRIGQGTRLPNTAALQVSLYGKPVKFDVAPRIEQNIPIAPFRHLIERAGGKVKWEHFLKQVNAVAQGREIVIRIGDAKATVDGKDVEMERTPFIEKGRTIIPLSFLESCLNVTIDFDPATGHVLILAKQ